jgi:hypothetical protein
VIPPQVSTRSAALRMPWSADRWEHDYYADTPGSRAHNAAQAAASVRAQRTTALAS